MTSENRNNQRWWYFDCQENWWKGWCRWSEDQVGWNWQKSTRCWGCELQKQNIRFWQKWCQSCKLQSENENVDKNEINAEVWAWVELGRQRQPWQGSTAALAGEAEVSPGFPWNTMLSVMSLEMVIINQTWAEHFECSGQWSGRSPWHEMFLAVLSMDVVDLLVRWYVWNCSLEYSKKLKFWWHRSFWWSKGFLRFMEGQGSLLAVLGKKFLKT